MRRALVIGAETGELSGVHNDVDTMTALLTQRDFAVEGRLGPDATRAGILDGYERLISETTADDAVVIYFSGHGGLARVVAPNGNPLPELQFIVPTDYAQSSPRDFRGITEMELSALLARLTRRTTNVTVIMDCCHAARMVRDPDLRVRALPHPTYFDIGVHIGMRHAEGLEIDLINPIGNPHAVRLMACASWESAYEYTNNNGERIGIATDSLRVALDEAGTGKVTWAALVQRIRNRVSTLAPSQRPEVEGPSHRLLFDVEEVAGGTRFSVVQVLPDKLSLPGAALLGVRPGDQLGITAAGAALADDANMVARATVSRTDGVTVQAAFELRPGHQGLPAVAEAHPLVTSQPREKVLVRGDGPLAEQVRTALSAEVTLRAVGPDDPPDDDPVLAEVHVGEMLSLWDGGTVALGFASADPTGLGRMLGDLVRLGRTARLRRLSPEPGEELTDPFTVEWGRVVANQAEPLPPTGSLLHVDEQIYLKLRNDSDRDLYFFVFDLGVAGAVTLLTSADPGGLRIAPKREHVVGEREGDVLKGSPLVWPTGVPTVDPRPETVLVLVTSSPQDLSVLTHSGVGLAVRGASSLRRTVTAALAGGTREWSHVEQPAVRYAVVHLECQLSVAPAPVRETAKFLVDERPDPSLRLLTPRSHEEPPSLAVRLSELVVHRNRALGGADIRVDALVVTADGGDVPPYRARTSRFSNVHDGDRLPLENLLVYHGPVVDYLDLAWWVSRDRSDSLALSDLLRERLTADDVRKAVAAMAALALAAPQAAVAAAAVSACAVIVDTAYRLLSGVVGNSIGLYRTSLLACEGFGVGRHPVAGVRRAQDFSFAYEILAPA